MKVLRHSVSPMSTVLLPLLIAYTGGAAIHGQRGGVIGAIATMGVIVGSDIPMFIGAMIGRSAGGLGYEEIRPAVGREGFLQALRCLSIIFHSAFSALF